MNVFQTNPVRKFSAMSNVIPVSIPTTSVSVPLGERVKRIHWKSVLTPGQRIVVLHRPQHAHHRLRQKRQRPGRGTRHNGSVDRSNGGRPSPNHIAIGRVRGGNSPQILSVTGELLAQLQAEATVNFSGDRASSGNSRRICIALPAGSQTRPANTDEQRAARTSQCSGGRHTRTSDASRPSKSPLEEDRK